MRALWACLGIGAVSLFGCGGRTVTNTSGDIQPVQGTGGAGSPDAGATATGGGVAGNTGGNSAGGLAGQSDIGGHPNGCCFSPRPTGGAPGTGGMAGSGTPGTGGVVATGGTGGAPATGGTGGTGVGPTACSNFAVGTAMKLAPAAAGQAYLRCGTLGPEKNWHATVSPTGDRLAALTAAGTVRLISTTTWTEIAQLTSPVGEMDAFAFSPDGTTLATQSDEAGEVTLWRAQDGAFQSSFAGPPASTLDTNNASVAFSSDGHRLASSLGIVIDLTTGTKINWMTGTPDTTTLAVNPENLNAGFGGVPLIRFTAGDSKLFVVTTYQIGNSPTSIRLELRDPVTADQTILYNMYDRALLGYAVSSDGRYIARAGSDEAAASTDPFKAGLYVIDGTLGTEVAGDPTSRAVPLAFSQDGSRLFTLNADTLAMVGTTDLHPISAFPWPSGTTFVGISPSGDVVGSTSSATSYFDPTSGAVVRTLPFPVTTIRWTADGRFAVGSGDPAALFHDWLESDGTQLCGPPAGTGSGPSIASLGTTVPPEAPNQGTVSRTSADGTVTLTESSIIHGHAQDFYADALTVTSTGALLRQFGDVGDAADTLPYVAMSVPAAARAYTPVLTPLQVPGTDVAVWCR